MIRAVGRSEKPGVTVLFGGHNQPLLVEIGLTDLPKNGGGHGTPGTPRDERSDDGTSIPALVLRLEQLQLHIILNKSQYYF